MNFSGMAYGAAGMAYGAACEAVQSPMTEAVAEAAAEAATQMSNMMYRAWNATRVVTQELTGSSFQPRFVGSHSGANYSSLPEGDGLLLGGDGVLLKVMEVYPEVMYHCTKNA